jgi:phage FluMu protein Com
MPIDVSCTGCHRPLRVPDTVAGKKIKCPKCEQILLVPSNHSMASTAVADAWQLKTEDGQQYGPVTKTELDQWFAEGRLTPQSQVLKSGAPQWQWATDVYPQLQASRNFAVVTPVEQNPFAFVGTGGAGTAVATRPQFAATGAYGRAAAAGNLSDKSKLAAGLLGIFLGGYGVHRFYLGYVGIGIAQILVTLVTCGIGGLWGFIEGVMILTGSINRDSDGRPLRD